MRLTPGLERLEVGQRFMRIFSLASFAPDDHFTLRAPSVAVTYAVRPVAMTPASSRGSSSRRRVVGFATRSSAGPSRLETS